MLPLHSIRVVACNTQRNFDREEIGRARCNGWQLLVPARAEGNIIGRGKGDFPTTL